MNEILYWLIGAFVVMFWVAFTFIIASHSYYNGVKEGIRAGREAAEKEALRNARATFRSMKEAAKKWASGLPITGDLRAGGTEMFNEIYKTLPESWTTPRRENETD